jgi:hypothetical protein
LEGVCYLIVKADTHKLIASWMSTLIPFWISCLLSASSYHDSVLLVFSKKQKKLRIFCKFLLPQILSRLLCTYPHALSGADEVRGE